MSRPAHHGPGGRYRNPWPEAEADDRVRGRFREIAWEWLTKRLPPNPRPDQVPVAPSDLAAPCAQAGELRVTWVGHATHLVQLPGLNLVTDPMWSPRASPVRWLGAPRFVPASPALRALPDVHAVLLTHDHYDHLDRPTVASLHERFGDDLAWFAPLGYRSWFAALGITNLVELDWWEEHDLPGGGYRVVAAPARHWTRRTPWSTNTRLWCSWAVVPATSSEDGDPRVYLSGDSAYASLFTEIGRRLGPFDATVLPIGAYDPRWFMSASHMSPEEAVQAYMDLGGAGAFIPSHWGTFRLTFEDPLEPPARLRAEWSARGLDARSLYVPRHGETVRVVTPC